MADCTYSHKCLSIFPPSGIARFWFLPEFGSLIFFCLRVEYFSKGLICFLYFSMFSGVSPFHLLWKVLQNDPEVPPSRKKASCALTMPFLFAMLGRKCLESSIYTVMFSYHNCCKFIKIFNMHSYGNKCSLALSTLYFLARHDLWCCVKVFFGTFIEHAGQVTCLVCILKSELSNYHYGLLCFAARAS